MIEHPVCTTVPAPLLRCGLARLKEGVGRFCQSDVSMMKVGVTEQGHPSSSSRSAAAPTPGDSLGDPEVCVCFVWHDERGGGWGTPGTNEESRIMPRAENSHLTWRR